MMVCIPSTMVRVLVIYPPSAILISLYIAEKNGMPKGLKITNHTGQALYNSTWIAVMDYDEDEFKDEDYRRWRL
jgi:hypothetical protein